jgi:hypothetical protein
MTVPWRFTHGRSLGIPVVIPQITEIPKDPYLIKFRVNQLDGSNERNKIMLGKIILLNQAYVPFPHCLKENLTIETIGGSKRMLP